MELTKEDILQINKEAPSDQGIFKEPWGIPVHIKEHVVYMRWNTGGMSGGNCWGDDPHSYRGDSKPIFKALDLVLKKLKPDVTFLQFRELNDLIHTNRETQYEYYGNSDDYEIEYIILSELIKKLETF